MSPEFLKRFVILIVLALFIFASFFSVLTILFIPRTLNLLPPYRGDEFIYSINLLIIYLSTVIGIFTIKKGGAYLFILSAILILSLIIFFILSFHSNLVNDKIVFYI